MSPQASHKQPSHTLIGPPFSRRLLPRDALLCFRRFSSSVSISIFFTLANCAWKDRIFIHIYSWHITVLCMVCMPKVKVCVLFAFRDWCKSYCMCWKLRLICRIRTSSQPTWLSIAPSSHCSVVFINVRNGGSPTSVYHTSTYSQIRCSTTRINKFLVLVVRYCLIIKCSSRVNSITRDVSQAIHPLIRKEKVKHICVAFNSETGLFLFVYMICLSRMSPSWNIDICFFPASRWFIPPPLRPSLTLKFNSNLFCVLTHNSTTVLESADNRSCNVSNKRQILWNQSKCIILLRNTHHCRFPHFVSLNSVMSMEGLHIVRRY